MTEDEMVDGITDNGFEFEQTIGDGERQESQTSCSTWGHKESDTTERLNKAEKEQTRKEQRVKKSPTPELRLRPFWRESGCCKNMRPMVVKELAESGKPELVIRLAQKLFKLYKLDLVYTSNLLGGGKPCFQL